MPLHILLCDEVLPYFILRIEVVRCLNLNLNKKELKLLKGFKVYPALPNPFNPARVKG
jgi:hypothetical protein